MLYEEYEEYKSRYYEAQRIYNDILNEKEELIEEIERLHSIIKEVRELVENDIDFKCITFRKADEDTWKLILASNIKEDFLEILDKENV